MRRSIVALVAVLVVSVPAVASHPPGSQVFAGTLEEGERDPHRFDNNPENLGCPDVMRAYVVQISYAPATDELLMEVDGEEVVAEHGTNATLIDASACTAFDVTVTGVDVAEAAAYEVHVLQLGPHP